MYGGLLDLAEQASPARLTAVSLNCYREAGCSHGCIQKSRLSSEFTNVRSLRLLTKNHGLAPVAADLDHHAECDAGVLLQDGASHGDDHAEYVTPQMMDSLRCSAVEEFSLESDVTPDQIACRAYNDALWDRKFDYHWQRPLHWYRKLVYFHRMGLLHDCFFQEFPGVSRTREFIRHVEPFALGSCQLYQESNCSEVFDYLRQLYDLPKREAITCPGQEEAAAEETANMVKEEL